MCGPLLRRFLGRHLMLCLGLGIVLVMSLAALCAPLLAPYNPNALHLDHILEPPSSMFWLGTDRLGRDVFSRLLYGGQISLWVGFVAVGISVSIGTGLGLISGYFGGLVDEGIMRGVDIMLCFPSFFLILSVIAFLEPSLTNIMIVIGLTSWMGVARLVRAETLSLRQRDFVSAARLSGCSTCRILLRHILPNTLAQCSFPPRWAWPAPSWWNRGSVSSGLVSSRPRPAGGTCSWKARPSWKMPPGFPFIRVSPSW